MQSYYRVACLPENPAWPAVEAGGIPIDKSGGLWIALIPTDHPHAAELRHTLGRVPTMFVNEYSRDEIASAEWLLVEPKGHHGYPQPEADWDLRTYDPTTFCRTCGMGRTQRVPFRLRKEPGAGRSHFLQLNWVFDEYFVRADARDGLRDAGITGIDFEAPLIHRSGLPSLSVDQMRIRTILPPAIDTSGLQPVTCIPFNEESHVTLRPAPESAPTHRHCGRVKHHLQHIGPLRIARAALDGSPDVVKSGECFGSGGSAFRLIVVSQRFRTLVEDRKWRGISFEPLQLV